MQAPTGLLVTFEGIEGSGKSTQIELTRAYVEAQGYPCLVTKEPGGSPLGEEIRGFLLGRGDLRIDPLAELFLIEAARAEHISEVIRPALHDGRIILCDRYTDATIAYQGYARGLDILVITQMNQLATEGLMPHCTIVLDLPIEVGMARAKGEDRFEREEKKFHQQVRDGYLRIARQEPQRVKVVSAEGEQSAIQREIQRIIRPLLDQK